MLTVYASIQTGNVIPAVVPAESTGSIQVQVHGVPDGTASLSCVFADGSISAGSVASSTMVECQRVPLRPENSSIIFGRSRVRVVHSSAAQTVSVQLRSASNAVSGDWANFAQFWVDFRS